MRDSNKLKEKYEVALDNRQLATLAVASLVVLGGVFLLGVVVGKKLTAEGAERTPADLLGQLDRKAAALESIKQQDASLTFQDELTRKAPPRAAETARAEKPVEKPAPEKGASAPPPAVAQPTAPAPVPVAVSPTALAAEAAADAGLSPVKLAESPRVEPVATRTHDGGGLKEAFGKAQRPPADTASDGAWTLQLAAYQTRGDADRFAAGLRDKGYAPFIVEAALPGRGTWFRVRMGRFPTRDAASRYLEDFHRETSMNALVTGGN